MVKRSITAVPGSPTPGCGGASGKAPAGVRSAGLGSERRDSAWGPHGGPGSRSRLCTAAESPPPPEACELAGATRQKRRIRMRDAAPASAASPPGRGCRGEPPPELWLRAAWRSRWRAVGGAFSWREPALQPAWRAAGCSRWTRSILQERQEGLRSPERSHKSHVCVCVKVQGQC